MTDIVERLRSPEMGWSADAEAIDAKVAAEAADEIERLRARPWQNLDAIIDALEKANLTRGGYVNAPEDVVANTIRDWLRGHEHKESSTWLPNN